MLAIYKSIQAATRILARQLVRLRQQITNLQGSRAQIRGVATHTQVGTREILLMSDDCNLYHFLLNISHLIATFLGIVC